MLYLHIGLHKTATTYFQEDVFPRWKGVTYLRNLSVEAFLKIQPGETCLASREGFSGGVIAHQSEKLAFMRRLSRMFPEARVLISFRSHGSYLNAIYSQYLRYGGTLPFAGFFDLNRNTGFIKREDLLFQSYIDAIRDYWGRPPFVFLLSELKEDMGRLMSDLGTFLGSDPPPLHSIATARRNVSLGRLQAEVLRRINSWSGVQPHRDGSTRPYRVLRRLNIDPPSLCQRWAQLRPGPSIIAPAVARQIDEYYSDDWAYLKHCVDFRREAIGAILGSACQPLPERSEH